MIAIGAELWLLRAAAQILETGCVDATTMQCINYRTCPEAQTSGRAKNNKTSWLFV